MVNVQKNHYYRKTVIPTTGAAKLSAVHKDTPLNESNTWTVAGGPSANRFVVSGSVPTDDSHKQGTLDYSSLVMRCSGTDLSTTARLPSVTMHKLKDNMTMTEGGIGINTNGERMMVFSHVPDTDNVHVEENFDGADRSLGFAAISDSVGGGLRQLGMGFGDPDELASCIYLGGTFSIFHMGEEVEGGSGDFLSTYFGRDELGGFENKSVIHVKPVNPAKLSGKWTVRFDNRTGLNKYTVFKPIWKWNDIKGLLDWRDKETKGGSTDENTAPPSPNNTIFSKIQMTPVSQTLATENLDGTPWVYSTAELSQERAVVGGQSLKLSHIWNDTDGTANSQNLYGPNTSINPQFVSCTIKDVPFPIPMDQAFASFGANIADVSGSAVMAPEMNVKLNISELGAMLEADPDTAIKCRDPIDIGNTYLHRTSGTTVNVGNVNLKTFLRSACVTFGNYLPEDGENMDSYIMRGLEDFYSSSVTGHPVTGGTADIGGHAQTKNRKVVGGIAFLRRANVNATGEDDDTNASNMYAMPLLTRLSPYQYTNRRRNHLMQIVSGNNASLANADAKVMAYSTRIKYASGTSSEGMSKDRMEPASYYTTAGGTAGQDYEPIVPIPLDTWFNMKFVWNMNGRNKGNQMMFDSITSPANATEITGTTTQVALISGGVGTGAGVTLRDFSDGTIRTDAGTTINNFNSTTVIRCSTNVTGSATDNQLIVQGDVQADLMRCYFTEGVEVSRDEVVGSTEVDDALNSDKPNAPPSLNVYFPVNPYVKASTAPSANNADWSWSDFPQYWPRYVILWLNNYRKIPKTEKSWGQTNGGTNGIFDSDFPPDSGSRHASMFVDSINLKNFYPEPIAHHGGANTFSKPINIKTTPVTTFMTSGARVSGTKGGATRQPNIQSGWSTRPNSAGEELSAAYTPTYICLGFEDKADAFYDTTGPEHQAALMFNGFSSPNINQLFRNTAFTTKVWASTVSGNSDTAAYDTRLAAVNSQGMDMFGAYYSAPFLSGTTGSTALPSMITQGNMADGKASTVTGTATATPFAFCLGLSNGGTGSRSMDGLTSKGVGEVIATEGTATQYSTGLLNNWVKRENPLASVKVRSVPPMDTNSPGYNNQHSIILVDNPDIFREETIGETTYCAYIAGSQLTEAQIKGSTATAVQNTTAGYNWSGSWDAGLLAAVTQRSPGFKQTKAPTRVGSMYAIHIDFPLNNFMDDVVEPWIYVSPMKYWLNFEVYAGDNVGGVDANYAVLSGTRTSSKTYDTIIPLNASSSATNMTGSTFNELTYGYNTTADLSAGRHGLYSKPWILDPGEKLETSLDLETDYGYGAFKAETQEGGEVDVKPAQTGLLTELDFSAIATKVKPEQPILMSLNLYKPTSQQSATFYGNDYTTDTSYKPYYLFGYHDEVPKVSNFSVGPAVEDILNKNLYSLTTENLNAVKFKFEVEGDDIWYKYMIINDSGSVQDKYDQCALWAPLNEQIPTDLSQPTFRAYSPDGSFDDSTQVFTNTGDKVKADIEGLAGYAAKFNGTDSDLDLANSVLNHPSGATDFSIVAHCIPASGMTGTNYVYIKGASSANGIEIYFSGSTSRNQKLYIKQRGTSLISKSIYPCDGKTPVSIVYTYKNSLLIGKRAHLWVNGVLEETADPGLIDNANDHTIGSDGSANAFDGHIEEFMIYKTRLVPVDKDDEYILNTADYSDKIGNDIANNTARLFAFDYTNIRGKNIQEVASSKNVTWRVDAP